MAIADYLNTVQKIYIAFYQRPADPAGLQYWAGRLDQAGGSLDGIIDAFANSNEAVNLYGPITSANIGRVIDAIYMALFNRLADEGGKQWYTGEFDAGRISAGNIALSILNGAREQDLVLINKKVDVSNKFVAALDTDAEVLAYSGDTAALIAREMLAQVDIATNPNAFYGIEAAIEDLINGSGIRDFLLVEPTVNGEAVPILMTAKESNVGMLTTAGNDRIIVNHLDMLHHANIDGGAGYNILEIDAQGTFAQPVALLNIQEVRIQNQPNIYTSALPAGGVLGDSTYPEFPNTAANLTEVIARTHFNQMESIHYEATRAGLDPQMVLGLIQVESNFRKYAISSAGARGFMQVMPFWLNVMNRPDDNLFHLRTNLRYGCTILRHYLDIEKGDLFRALGRYNGSLGKAEYPNLVRGAWERHWSWKPEQLAARSLGSDRRN